jgi:hypothetical protein
MLLLIIPFWIIKNKDKDKDKDKGREVNKLVNSKADRNEYEL